MDLSTLDNALIQYIEQAEKQRNEAAKHFQLGLEHIFKAIEVAPKYSIELILRSKVQWFQDDLSKYVKSGKDSIDKALWRGLIEQSNLGRYMNKAQIDAMRDQIEEEVMEFKKETAFDTLRGLMASRDQVFLKGIVDVFRHLSGNFKSHSAFKVGRKLILNQVLTSGYGAKSVSNMHFAYGSNADAFIDFWKYCYLLNGKNPVEIKPDSTPQRLIELGMRQGESHFVFDDFSVRCFLNGNMHLYIEKPELIDKINRAIAQYYNGKLPQGANENV